MRVTVSSELETTEIVGALKQSMTTKKIRQLYFYSFKHAPFSVILILSHLNLAVKVRIFEGIKRSLKVFEPWL